MKKTIKTFKITVGAAGLIVTSLAGGTTVQENKDHCAQLLASPLCNENVICEEMTVADVLKALKEKGCLNVENLREIKIDEVLKELELNERIQRRGIEVMRTCGSCIGGI